MQVFLVFDPALYPGVCNKTIYEWRQFLKARLLDKRGWRSDLSGKHFKNGCHMHEGIVTRANIDKSVGWHWRIYHEYNSFLLSPDEHIPQPPTKAWCIAKAYELYGEDAVREWYYNLPFKGKPPFYLP